MNRSACLVAQIAHGRRNGIHFSPWLLRPAPSQPVRRLFPSSGSGWGWNVIAQRLAANGGFTDVQEVILHSAIRVRDIHIRGADQWIYRFLGQSIPVTVSQLPYLIGDVATFEANLGQVVLGSILEIRTDAVVIAGYQVM